MARNRNVNREKLAKEKLLDRFNSYGYIDETPRKAVISLMSYHENKKMEVNYNVEN